MTSIISCSNTVHLTGRSQLFWERIRLFGDSQLALEGNWPSRRDVKPVCACVCVTWMYDMRSCYCDVGQQLKWQFCL